MTEIKNKRLLAISPGYFCYGVAVVEGERIRRLEVKNLCKKVSLKENLKRAKKYLQWLLAFERPEVLVLPKEKTKTTAPLLSAIENFIKEKGVKVVAVEKRKIVEGILEGKGRGALILTLARKLSSSLSFLKEFPHFEEGRRRYWSRMVTALGLVFACQRYGGA